MLSGESGKYVLRVVHVCVCVCFVCLFVYITPEGLNTMVAKVGLEKARACLNKVPCDRHLTSTPKDAV